MLKELHLQYLKQIKHLQCDPYCMNPVMNMNPVTNMNPVSKDTSTGRKQPVTEQKLRHPTAGHQT